MVLFFGLVISAAPFPPGTFSVVTLGSEVARYSLTRPPIVPKVINLSLLVIYDVSTYPVLNVKKVKVESKGQLLSSQSEQSKKHSKRSDWLEKSHFFFEHLNRLTVTLL